MYNNTLDKQYLETKLKRYIGRLCRNNVQVLLLAFLIKDLKIYDESGKYEVC